MFGVGKCDNTVHHSSQTPFLWSSMLFKFGIDCTNVCVSWHDGNSCTVVVSEGT